ncbi:hypothetical protein EBO34_17410 [Alteribacter keqinensis]|uniref:Uncharacterized protein n=1 Tax=Alteribacter keqinensis TaxID=2483800 RepID=A0A3M7TMW1_9BACI|nr:hypothetical protein EBO34_17410 [Alteribacter keqinensis]
MEDSCGLQSGNGRRHSIHDIPDVSLWLLSAIFFVFCIHPVVLITTVLLLKKEKPAGEHEAHLGRFTDDQPGVGACVFLLLERR